MSHDCRHLLGDLSNYLDGEASAALCAEIERHVTECEDCRVVVDSLRRTVRLYRQLPQPGLPPAARERLLVKLNLEDFAPPPDGASAPGEHSAQ